MPRFDKSLARQAHIASRIVHAGENVRVKCAAVGRKEWTDYRLEGLYEFAFLRVFAAWEACIESAFYKSLCGYESIAGTEALIAGPYFKTRNAAEAAVLKKAGKVDYVLWHNPQAVIMRCRAFIVSGVPGYPGLQESVISSNLARLKYFAAVRHRIAHNQADARKKFNFASIQLASRTFRGSRPGKLLRDWDTSLTPKRRRIDVFIDELVGLASQIV